MFRGSTMAQAALTAALAFSAMSTAAGAQVFQVNYYANANTAGVSADATVRITNPGTNGAPSPSGDLCALIYVFSADQQLAECCGCKVTPNGLRTISVRNDLTSNPLTPVTLNTGAIKIVSSNPPPGLCDPTSPAPTPALIAWATHVQTPTSSSTGVVTETAFEDATLSAAELGVLTEKCTDIGDNGSGHGVCSCGVEPTGPGS